MQSVGINVLVFCGVDTSICVETSIRDAFNLGYDVVLISDATASGIKNHYETTLDRVRDYYGLQHHPQMVDQFINEFGLSDFRNLREIP